MRKSIFRSIYIAIAVVAAVAMLFPIYWTVVSSLKTTAQLFLSNPTLYPPTPQWSEYSKIFLSEIGDMVTSLIIGAGSVILGLAISAPAAFALSQFRMRISSGLLLALLIVQMIPGISLATALFVIFHKVGLLNSYVGLILADGSYSVPFSVLLLRAYMLTIPRELLEATLIDGTNEWGAFFRVFIPISVPALATVSLFAFLFGWGDFLFALTMTTNNTIEPVTLGIFKFIGVHVQDWNGEMTFAVIASVPAAAVLIAAQRYITEGISSSGLKG